MAHVNSTSNPVSVGFHSSSLAIILASQSEKISCSFSPFTGIDPAGLLGRRISVDEFSDIGLNNDVYNALVVGIQIGCPGLGVETLLLLRRDDSDFDDFVSVSRMSILAVHP
ncbi:hypothetical protein [Pseudomonas coronafaciens]|uniref:Uncharacterized protein n=1 Tax=Pseudomonas coronafaciens pv. coronafaciens TaxID=235275 RepID=A0AAE6QG28_9PSED|nr:hypothetical protein [Pseudomonas coronafaciens]QGT82096.1 hypothetical protein GMO17_13325 [Pseudomonas coronafaciens pv. coronafaciens]